MTYRINVTLQESDAGVPGTVITETGEEPWALANLAVRELENEMLARFPEIPEPDLSIPLLTEAWWQSLRKRRHAAHPIVLPSEPEPIPAKVVEVEDRDGDRWHRTRGPGWRLVVVGEIYPVILVESELIRQYGPVAEIRYAVPVPAYDS